MVKAGSFFLNRSASRGSSSFESSFNKSDSTSNDRVQISDTSFEKQADDKSIAIVTSEPSDDKSAPISKSEASDKTPTPAITYQVSSRAKANADTYQFALVLFKRRSMTNLSDGNFMSQKNTLPPDILTHIRNAVENKYEEEKRSLIANLYRKLLQPGTHLLDELRKAVDHDDGFPEIFGTSTLEAARVLFDHYGIGANYGGATYGGANNKETDYAGANKGPGVTSGDTVTFNETEKRNFNDISVLLDKILPQPPDESEYRHENSQELISNTTSHRLPSRVLYKASPNISSLRVAQWKVNHFDMSAAVLSDFGYSNPNHAGAWKSCHTAKKQLTLVIRLIRLYRFDHTLKEISSDSSSRVPASKISSDSSSLVPASNTGRASNRVYPGPVVPFLELEVTFWNRNRFFRGGFPAGSSGFPAGRRRAVELKELEPE